MPMHRAVLPDPSTWFSEGPRPMVLCPATN